MIAAPLEVGIVVKNLDKLRDFYIKVFKLCEISRIQVIDPPNFILSSETYTVIRLQFPNGERLKLIGSEATEVSGETPSSNLASKRNLFFITVIVEDMEKTRDAIKLNGGVLLEDPITLREAMRVSFATDPEGNLIELTEYKPISIYRTDLQTK
jgi:predicted enzyme related to lactoylglutathione lyase